MSQQVANAGSAAETTNQSGSAGEEKIDFVSKSAYEDVSKDMHKFKSKLRETQAYTNELESRLKALEEEKMAEQAQWKELFEKRNSEFENLQNQVEERDRRYMEAVKKNALKAELGGKIRDEYLIHADINSIALNDDGTINQDSLLSVANNFRQTHSSLIPVQQTANVTSIASPSGSTIGQGLKPLNQMSLEEKKGLMNNPELMAEYRAKGLI